MTDTPELHIIDSEIRGQGGHNLSFAKSICDGAHDITIHIWADRSTTFEYPNRNVTIHRYFRRRFRKLQTLALATRLLKGSARLLFSTASSADLFALYLARRFRPIKPHQVFLFFHFLNRMEDPGKQRFYEKMARALPRASILAPAESVRRYLGARGFIHVNTTPYPINESSGPANAESKFNHLLVSGHLRIDKGAAALADLVEFLAASDQSIPVYFQGHEDSSRYTENELGFWRRIVQARYKNLRVFPCALDPEEYQSLFRGAISLQLYDAAIFSDRASGAALDALINGTPIIALRGSWNARLVEKYGAGFVLDHTGPQDILGAVSAVTAAYDQFRDRALLAGAAIRKTHSSQAILNQIFGS